PVPLEGPKKTTQERSIWSVEEMRAALASMEDPILHLAVHLTLVGALREGEVAGLTPEDIDFDAAGGVGTFSVNKSMQRVQKESLSQVGDSCVLKAFEDKREGSKTRSEEHTSELQSRFDLVCRLLLEKKKPARYY